MAIYSIPAIIAEIQAQPELVAIGYDFGQLELESNNDWPRIVWVHTGGQIAATQHPGGRLYTPAPGIQTRERAIATNQASMTCNIWGEDLAAAGIIMHDVIACTWRILVGCVTFGGYRCFNQQQAEAEYARRGQMVMLDMTWLVPVVDEVKPLTALAHQGQTDIFEGRHGDEIIYQTP